MFDTMTQKQKDPFKWRPIWNIERTVKETAEWYYRYNMQEDMSNFTVRQIGCMYSDSGQTGK